MTDIGVVSVTETVSCFWLLFVCVQQVSKRFSWIPKVAGGVLLQDYLHDCIKCTDDSFPMSSAVSRERDQKSPVGPWDVTFKLQRVA